MTALTTATALPEGQAYPRLHAALDGLLVGDRVGARVRAAGRGALVRYELLLLAELGFGLDLDACTVTGTRDGLAFVSPKSGCAVSVRAQRGMRRSCCPTRSSLPTTGARSSDACETTGHFLARDLLLGRAADTLAARERLIDRLKRAGGVAGTPVAP